MQQLLHQSVQRPCRGIRSEFFRLCVFSRTEIRVSDLTSRTFHRENVFNSCYINEVSMICPKVRNWQRTIPLYWRGNAAPILWPAQRLPSVFLQVISDFLTAIGFKLQYNIFFNSFFITTERCVVISLKGIANYGSTKTRFLQVIFFYKQRR